jgi:hypothetical protein
MREDAVLSEGQKLAFALPLLAQTDIAHDAGRNVAFSIIRH